MESSVYTTLKNTEKVCLQCHKLDDYNHYIIEAISTVGEKVAYTTFRIKEHNTCCLMKIEIINPSYAHQGLGTKMLIFMEYLASKQYCSKIDGKFYPFGDLGEFAREFTQKMVIGLSKNIMIQKYLRE